MNMNEVDDVVIPPLGECEVQGFILLPGGKIEDVVILYVDEDTDTGTEGDGAASCSPES